MKIRLNVTIEREVFDKIHEMNKSNPEQKIVFSHLLAQACVDKIDSLGMKPAKDRILALSNMVLEHNKYLNEIDETDGFQKWKKDNDIQTI